MYPQKILIYGAQGWIGGMLVKRWKMLYPSDTIIESTTRLVPGNEPKIIEEIFNSDRVICCIGRTSGTNKEGKFINTIDYLEDQLYENTRDNIFAPVLLASLCSQFYRHLLYLGTGCIFSWDTSKDQDRSITEEDYPDFFGSAYSTVKGFTDTLMKNFRGVCNCRIRMPIVNFDHPRNFITKIVSYKNILDMPNSMTYLPEILNIMIKMSKTEALGTFNMTNPGFTSHKEILDMYTQIVDPSHTYNLVKNEGDLNLLSKRSNNILDTTNLEIWCKENGCKLSSIQDCITNCFLGWNKQNKKYFLANLLVTGGLGFIGSHFINYIHQTYPETNIINIDRVDYCSDENNVTNTSDKYVLYKIDLNDKDEVTNILFRHEIDSVVHFAAQSHVDNSFGNSLQFTTDNVMGTHTLLECCRNYQDVTGNLQKIVHISTDEVYGEVELDHEGCTEKSLLDPTNPYAATKAAAEFIARSYYHSFKLPIVITRGNNVFGYNQYPEKLIPKFIKQLLGNEKLTIHGKGESRRNFIYVDDVCNAVDLILHFGKPHEIFNIGSKDEYSVMDIATLLIKKLKGDDAVVEEFLEFVPDRLFNDKRYSVECSRLHELGWQQSTTFSEGLQLVIEHFKNKLK